MPTAPSFGVRLLLGCLDIPARVMLIAGLSISTAGGLAMALRASSPLARLLPIHSLRFGLLLVAAAWVALALLTSRAALLGAERADVASGPREPDAIRWGFGVTLVAVPALVLWRLGPLWALWRETFAQLDGLGPWEFRGGLDLSGIVLMPLFAVLALPAFETVAGCSFVAVCGVLLATMVSGSPVRLRAFMVSIALLAGLAMGALLGDDTMRQAIPMLLSLMHESAASFPSETAQATRALVRYHRVTHDAGQVLAWAWMALAAWIPFMLFAAASSVRAVAATRMAGRLVGDEPLGESPEAAEALAPPEGADRERFYSEAARLVERGGASRQGGGSRLILVLAALGFVGLVVLLSGFGVIAALSRFVTR